MASADTGRKGHRNQCGKGCRAMNFKDADQMNFLSEMSDRQVSARQFFSHVLLDSLDRNFGLRNVLISCFDQEGNFLSWTDRNGVLLSSPEHPYTRFASEDVVSRVIYQDAVKARLTYTNVNPLIYRASDVIGQDVYDNSSYARFLEENFGAHYSVILPFGTNAYIHIFCYKSMEEGDFTDREIEELKKIYVYVAHAYKNFKRHEQVKIISTIQDEIISSHENAYLITDDNMHILGYNQTALDYLTKILGSSIKDQLITQEPCPWLPFLLGETSSIDHVQTRVIKGYIFKIYTYEQTYQHGIIDRYHWITLSQEAVAAAASGGPKFSVSLTPTEEKVAELLCAGLTYQAAADELVVSYHTIKNHVQNIFSKCGVKNRYQLYQLLKK